jgi:hypothetical protein
MKKRFYSILIILISLILIFGFPSSISAKDSNLIHGVVPTKVTAHLHEEYPDAAGQVVIVDYYWEFWNVGKLGGEKYSKAKLTIVYAQNGPSTPSIYEGYFTGGPNGDFHVEIKGHEWPASKLNGGKVIVSSNGYSFPVDNPEAFNGWDDEIIEAELTKPTIQLILLEGPVDLGNGQVKYTIKALASGNPAPTVEFSRTPQDSISPTDTKNVITVVTGKNEILGLTATATNSEGSATAALGFPPPTIELVAKEGPIENPDKTVTYIIEAKVTGTPEPTVEFSTNDPQKVTVIDNLNIKITLNQGDNILVEATAKNEFGQANSKIEFSIQEKTRPTLNLVILSGPTDDGNGQVSYILEAKVTGFPEPTVKFNRDDSDGGSGKNRTTVKLLEEEEFTLTATAENSEGKVEDSIVLSAPSIPKIELEIMEGPVWVNIESAYYIVEAVVKGFPEPEVIWNYPKGIIFWPVGKNKKKVYVREGDFARAPITAYAKNSIGQSEKKEIWLEWVTPPANMFTERTFTIVENYKMKGKLFVKRAGKHNWVEVNQTLTLYEGDDIKTDDTGAAITASDLKGHLVLGPNAYFSVGRGEDGKAIIMSQGDASFKITGAKDNSEESFIIQNKFGNAKPTGTDFVINTDENQTVLKVIDGTVEFTSTVTGDMVIINSGESIKATEKGFEEKTSFDIETENDYWNKLESNIETNSGALNSISNFLVNLQNKLNGSGISNTLILVIGIGIIFLIIALVVLIMWVMKIKAR